MVQSFIRLLVVSCCAIAGLHGGPAEARRVALVIGNADYKVGPLQNPVNDAAAVAEAFDKQLKFDKVILRKNLGAEAFRAALLELSREASGADLGVVYFAGHGTEVAGRNYLIPIDARLAKAGDLGLEAIPLDTVLDQLAGVTRLRLVILDACRHNIFPLAGATRSGTRGLYRIEPEENTLVVYAAKDGTTADDGKGRHSPFTESLLKHVVRPGLDVRRLFGAVRNDVMAATGRQQQPHLYGTLGEEEIFLQPAAVVAVPAPVAMPAAPPPAVNQPVALATPPPALPTPPKVVEPAVGAFTPGVTPLSPEHERSLKRGDSFKECDLCPEMVVVPAGEFIMGSNDYDSTKPPHRVTIRKPFGVGKFEVTFAEWDACVDAGGCSHRPDDRGWGRGRRPVINVLWNEAKEYAAWLSHKTGKTYRLLTEAEWEYAARAGTTTRYAFGHTITKRQAHFLENASDTAHKTVEVGSFPANGFGVHDMHGNVWEWVEDNWHPNYVGAPDDGSEWRGGDAGLGILRGGAWDFPGDPITLRSDFRNWYHRHRGARIHFMGFRVAKTL